MAMKAYVIKHIKTQTAAQYVVKIDYKRKDYKLGSLEEAMTTFSFFEHFQAERERLLLEQKFKAQFSVEEA